MPNPNVTEIKAFVPARDFTLSKQFYQDLGFTLASDGDGVAYFHLGNASFLLQDGNPPGLAEQLMMHLLVEDVAAWQAQVETSQVAARYGVRVTELVTQPWRMKEFCLYDPSGVLWRIAQNID
ncbi:VOC family protein [Aeromonas caviae]